MKASDLLLMVEGRQRHKGNGYLAGNTRKSKMASAKRNKVNHVRHLACATSEICGVTKEVFLLVLMVSAPMNFERRERQRHTCLNVSGVSGKRIEKLFLLGDSGNSSLNMRIKEESLKFQDVFIGDYHDSYGNLTLKTLSGMKWARLCCPQATYVMKVDDDVYINFKILIDTLINAPRKKGYIVGRVSRGSRPVRDKTHKWYVSLDTYSRKVYPDYVSGLAYVMSGDLPRKIYYTSISTPPFPWEDVYIGMILEKLNVRPKHNTCFQTFKTRRKIKFPCKFISACAIHFMDPENVFRHYNKLTTEKTNATNRC
ncbi:Beta-1,3-galactosyltransferase 1 [Holothuria leucospilota]|uniref:Hexosyltransferase n=1 Tax=Holothuria leucospilota TaxID=206669 RepID=A0A9Q1C6I9_HOLLE|nr:Beta-1,3-galactosyltransferase 1 [Holothuria leucospilota]